MDEWMIGGLMGDRWVMDSRRDGCVERQIEKWMMAGWMDGCVWRNDC